MLFFILIIFLSALLYLSWWVQPASLQQGVPRKECLPEDDRL